MTTDQDAALAIDGGSPVIPEGPPNWPRPEEAVREALEAAYADGSWGRYHGPHCEQLSELLAGLCGVSHVWLCSSGTIGVELALRGVKVGPGDEVILAGYDFPGNFRAIEAVGARPVLVDLAARSWTIDAEQVVVAITPSTKAIIASHLHGNLANMRRLRELADERGVALIEDACQTPGAVVGGRQAGSWGDCGVLSFGGSKLLTAGRGGAIVSQREDVIQRIKIWCQRGNDAFPLSELQTAVLIPQIPRLAAANAQRAWAVDWLLEACRDLPGLIPFSRDSDRDNRSVFYKVPWQLEGNRDDCGAPDFEQVRRRWIAALRAEGVAVEEGFRGFARRSGQRCRVAGTLAHSRRAAARTVILHHPVLLEPRETLCRVAQAMEKVSRRLLAIK